MNVDALMARCPLKQEIRDSLWAAYVATLTRGAPLANYLTLYSPPLMDVKHLEHRGLLSYADGVYKGVVGVTIDAEAFAEASRQTKGRLDLMLSGDINRLLVGGRGSTEYSHQLHEKFPFQAINLDYTNPLFAEKNTNPLSLHLAAIDTLIGLQARHNIRSFCLFVTTRTGDADLAPAFVADLERRLDHNVTRTPGFGTVLRDIFGTQASAGIRTAHRSDFMSLGIAKLITQTLADHNFEVLDTDAIWLVRDTAPPLRELLHLAFLVRRPQAPRARTLTDLGRRRARLESKVLGFLRKRRATPFRHLRETADQAPMQVKHGNHITALVAKTFEEDVLGNILRDA